MTNRENNKPEVLKMDFEESFRAGSYEEITMAAHDSREVLFALQQSNDTENLKKSLHFLIVMLEYFRDYVQEDKEQNAIFQTGMLMGYVELMDRLEFQKEQDTLVTAKAKLLGTRHLDEIVMLLDKNGSMSQSALGEALQLNPSTLSETLKKVRQTQLVQVSPYGKFKLYTLSDEGIRYARLRRKKQEQQINSGAVTIFERDQVAFQNKSNSRKTPFYPIDKAIELTNVSVPQKYVVLLVDDTVSNVTERNYTIGEVSNIGHE